MMTPDQYLSEIADLAAEAQDAQERGDIDECLMSLDYILDNINKVMKILEADQ
ncbi:MAG: hypothetical protein WC343_10055 [Bacilli bacterium]|jgi:hypothetical protein